MNRYIKDQEVQAAWETSGQLGARPEPLIKPPARPMLLIVPAEVITQWEDDVSRFNPKIKCMIYYGPKSQAKKGGDTHVGEILTRKSHYFNGEERNATTLIITSPETFRMRHGPGALKHHRISQLGWSPEAADASLNIPDKGWDRDLSGLFDLVTIDEAHAIKSPSTGINTAIQWLESPFTVMVTATVLPNDITDCEGYIQLVEGGRDLWNPANLQKWEVSEDVNPFELPDDHPAAVLRLSLQAVKNWITGPKADTLKRSFYLQKIWKKCLVRRTYVSKDPACPENIIGASLPKLYTRNIICRFNRDEQAEYDALSARPLQRLAHFLPDGKVCWNRRYARQLMLLSTATWYHWVNPYMTAETVKDWMQSDNCLWSIVKAIHTFKTEATGDAGFILPEKQETTKLLALLFQGSPKLRQVLQVIGSLVVLSQQKIAVWCGLPANQVLLWACLQALNIDSAIYTANLTSLERQELVKKFTQDPDKCVVWVGSFSVGSVGLNLQAMCHHSINFDSPINTGQAKQAVGRIRRLKQPHTVEQLEVSVENSFQSRIIQNALKKAVPGATVDLSMDVQEQDTNDSDNNLTKAFSIGCWFRVGDQLIEAPDPQVDHLPQEQQLSAEELVSAILDIHRGRREESHLNHTWVEESADAEMIDVFYDME